METITVGFKSGHRACCCHVTGASVPTECLQFQRADTDVVAMCRAPAGAVPTALANRRSLFLSANLPHLDFTTPSGCLGVVIFQ